MSVPGVGYRRRVLLVFLGAAAFFVFLIGRLAWIQFYHGEHLRAEAMDVRMRDIPVEAKRGTIYDRNLQPLAVSINADSVYAMPAQIKRAAETARILADTLHIDYERTLNRLTQNSSFVYIKRKISPEESRAIRALIRDKKLPGVDVTQEGKRVYTTDRIAAHILGIAGIDSQGLEGLEKQYDQQLKGKSGRIQVETDARGRAIDGAAHQYVPPQDGNTLVTTLDVQMQYIAQRGVQKAMLETKAKRAGIIVMDVKTGGILAMAMTPDYDPNNYQDFPDGNRRNWMIADTLEPGSMFKPVVAAAAMNEGKINAQTPFSAPGTITVADRRISNWNFMPVNGTLMDVVAQSSNTGFVQIGFMLGMDKFYEYVRAFGLMEETGLDLPGEAKGIFPPQKRATQLDLAVMSFGQTFTATPLQIVRAMSAIGNNGKLMQPHFVQEIRSPDGKVLWRHSAEPVRQVISPQIAQELSNLLEKVISEGTGRNAYVPGYKVAGKTGTAEKLPRGSGKYIADFVGFAPVEDPRLGVVVIIDEPQGVYYGGQIAAPVFSAIMGDLLRYLEIPPQLPLMNRPGDIQPKPTEEVKVPSLLNLPVPEAERVARSAGLSLRVDGGGPTITRQLPPPGVMVVKGTTVAAEAKPEVPLGPGLVTVPDLTRKTLREAADILAQRNLQVRFSGTGVVVRQEPLPGGRVPVGSAVTLQLEPPP